AMEAASVLPKSATSPISQRTEVRSMTWSLQMMEDAIVPTEPVRIGVDDTSEKLRQRLLRERKALLPATLGRSRLHEGYALDLPAGNGKAAWHAEKMTEVISATVRESHAEICWNGALPPVNIVYHLVRDDGYELAVLHTDGKGGSVMLTTTHVRQ